MEPIEKTNIPDYLSHLPKEFVRQIVARMAAERNAYNKIREALLNEEKLPEMTAKQTQNAKAFKSANS